MERVKQHLPSMSSRAIGQSVRTRAQSGATTSSHDPHFQYLPESADFIPISPAFNVNSPHSLGTPNSVAGINTSVEHSHHYSTMTPSPQFSYYNPNCSHSALSAAPDTGSSMYGDSPFANPPYPPLPPGDPMASNFIQYSDNVNRVKRPRGTTGTILCEQCDKKFTIFASLTRHNKTCHGIDIKKSKPSQLTISKIPSVSSLSDRTNHAGRTRPELPREAKKVVTLKPKAYQLPAANPRNHPRSGRDAIPKRNPIPSAMSSTVATNSPFSAAQEQYPLPISKTQGPQGPQDGQPYVPRGPDTSADRNNFFCDICPSRYPSRDLLQLHKYQVHDLKEVPRGLGSGAFARPPFLNGVTEINASKHSLASLKIWQIGGLSTSACKPCIDRGVECFVDPSGSSRCCYCNYRDQGVYCGAAGVNYR